MRLRTGILISGISFFLISCGKKSTEKKTVSCVDSASKLCVEFTADSDDADSMLADCESPKLKGAGACTRTNAVGICTEVEDDKKNKGTMVYYKDLIVDTAKNNCSALKGVWSAL